MKVYINTSSTNTRKAIDIEVTNAKRVSFPVGELTKIKGENYDLIVTLNKNSKIDITLDVSPIGSNKEEIVHLNIEDCDFIKYKPNAFSGPYFTVANVNWADVDPD